MYTFFIHKFQLHMLLGFHVLQVKCLCRHRYSVKAPTDSSPSAATLLSDAQFYKAGCYLGPTSAERFNGLLGLLRLVTAMHG